MDFQRKEKGFLKSIKRALSSISKVISSVINSILLSIVYLLGVGPTSIIAKLSKKRFLDSKKSKTTYWKPLNLNKKQTKSYYRQF